MLHCTISKSYCRVVSIAFIGAAVLWIGYVNGSPGVLIGSEIVQVGEGETSYFLQKCRYVSIRGKVFVQEQGEESRWRLEQFPCEVLVR